MRINPKIITAGVFVVLVLGWWLSDRAVHYRNMPPLARGPWIAFGDSLTEGYGASPTHSYPDLLGLKLGVKIENHGVSGESSQAGLNRLETVAQIQPRVVLLCFGGNDGLQQMSRLQMIANVSQMIDRFHQGGSFVVLIGIRSVGLRDQNEKAFCKLAREKQVLYVPDLLDGIMFRPVLMADALHPNDAGYEVFAGRLEKILRPWWPELRPTP